jgi:trans-aconitate methyltransferase
MDPKQIVAQGYDAIAERQAEWASRTRADERERYTAVLLNALPPGAQVLELGCGVGVPTTQRLARRFAVTGVNISVQHIALARRNVPTATFVQADMAAHASPFYQ